MKGSNTGRSAVRRRLIGAGLVAVLAFATAACGDDTTGESTSGTEAGTSDTASATTAPADLLGPDNAATGEPVVVGLMGTGGDCPDCSEGGALEEPAARATVGWINDHLGGLAGHPMELEVCNNDLDPSKSIDCANQMITDGAVAVITGADSTVTGWQTLHDAGIPVISFSTTESSYLDDADSTFVLQGSESLTVGFPIGVAEEIGTDKVSIIVIDLPAATDIYNEDSTQQKFEDAGLDPDIVPIDLGVLDMTSQAQDLVRDNPDGEVFIVGHDAFCIPAINGLMAVGFTGTIATISFCTTDAMREAIPGDVLEGMRLSASDTLGDPSDPSAQQYNAVMDEYAESDIPRDSSSPLAIYASYAALAIGTAGLEGEVTPDSIIDAMRSMDNEILPGSGGRQFRCNGNAEESSPSVCMASGLSATLDAEGRPVSYTVVNDVPIPD